MQNAFTLTTGIEVTWSDGTTWRSTTAHPEPADAVAELESWREQRRKLGFSAEIERWRVVYRPRDK
jgi:hypothetical protein